MVATASTEHSYWLALTQDPVGRRTLVTSQLELEAGHSIECITHHRIFAPFDLELWPFHSILTGGRSIVMNYPCASLVVVISAGLILSGRQTQTYRITHTQTDAAKRHTRATVVGVSNCQITTSMWITWLNIQTLDAESLSHFTYHLSLTSHCSIRYQMSLIIAVMLSRTWGSRTRTWSPRTRTCKLVLEDKDFPQGQQHWVTAKNAYLLIQSVSNNLISVSRPKPFFTITSCIVAVTEFMDHLIIHNGLFAECKVIDNFWGHCRPRTCGLRTRTSTRASGPRTRTCGSRTTTWGPRTRTKTCGSRTRTWGPRTRTCKLVLENFMVQGPL